MLNNMNINRTKTHKGMFSKEFKMEIQMNRLS